MRAKVGDLLVVHGTKLDAPLRRGEILEVRGAGGEPPFLVRWQGDDHESLVFPGPDCVLEQQRRKRKPRRR